MSILWTKSALIQCPQSVHCGQSNLWISALQIQGVAGAMRRRFLGKESQDLTGTGSLDQFRGAACAVLVQDAAVLSSALIPASSLHRRTG
jgi:hypothetical protein